MKKGLGFIGGLTMLLWAGTLLAQPSPSYAPGNRYEQVQSLILMRVSNDLNLDARQTQQMGAILSRHYARKKQLRGEVRQLTAALKDSVGNSDSPQTKTLVARLDAARRQLNNSNDAMYAEARRMLTPQQQAQFMLVMDELKREVRSVRQPNVLVPQGDPYAPGSPYFPAPALPTNDSIWVR